MDLIKKIMNNLNQYIFDLAINISNNHENIDVDDVLNLWCDQQKLDKNTFEVMLKQAKKATKKLEDAEDEPTTSSGSSNQENNNFCTYVQKRGKNIGKTCEKQRMVNSLFCTKHTK